MVLNETFYVFLRHHTVLYLHYFIANPFQLSTELLTNHLIYLK
jgi:hypothetical protein